MTPESQQIVIAEALGRTNVMKDAGGLLIAELPGSTVVEYVPDYLQDLDAMHKAEMVLIERNLFQDYWPVLESIMERDGNYIGNGSIALATAEQRAECFILTIGKWDDES